MNKFENVDVLASLQQIMQQNTAAFQNDFDIDKKILTQAAKSKNAKDKVYLWFSRPNGTHCLRERDVFLRGTREHTSLFHLPDSSTLMDSRDNIKPLSGIGTQVHTLRAIIGFQIIRSVSTMSRPRSVYLPMPWCCPAWRAAR